MRAIHKLSDAEILTRTISLPTDKKCIKLGDGGGLVLIIDRFGARWLFTYTSPVTRKRREMGLGPWPATTLADARNLSAEAREVISRWLDPLIEWSCGGNRMNNSNWGKANEIHRTRNG